MIIKVLGSGCAKCIKLYDNVNQALTTADRQATVEKVQDIDQIIDYGVMMTPALVIDEQVVSTGKVLSIPEIISLLQSQK